MPDVILSYNKMCLGTKQKYIIIGLRDAARHSKSRVPGTVSVENLRLFLKKAGPNYKNI